MDITVIICTYNRCQSLEAAIASVLASTIPASIHWEVLVVDNNSTDATRLVVEDMAQRCDGRVRYLFEPRQGLSCARNAGIREARGEIVAFTDDDVMVEPGWLQNLTASLGSGQWAGAGGPIVAQWTGSPPAWLPLHDQYGVAPLAMFDPHLEAGPLDESPFGANMAFRKEMFKKYGEFRADLGRCGAKMLSNEDTEFGERLLRGGERLRFEPAAAVRHSVPENRVRQSYFLNWWFDKARADVRQYGVEPDEILNVMGIPLYLFRRLLRWTFQWAVTIEPSKRFSCKTRVWRALGAIAECYRQPSASIRVSARGRQL